MAHCIVCDGAYVGELNVCPSCDQPFHSQSCGATVSISPSGKGSGICAICAGRYSRDPLQRRRQIAAKRPAIVQLRRPHFVRDYNEISISNRVSELNAKIIDLRERIARLDFTIAMERGHWERRSKTPKERHVDSDESLETKREDWRRIAGLLSEEKARRKALEVLLHDHHEERDRVNNLRKYQSCLRIIETYREALSRIEEEGKALSFQETDRREMSPQRGETQEIEERIKALLEERQRLSALLDEVTH